MDTLGILQQSYGTADQGVKRFKERYEEERGTRFELGDLCLKYIILTK